MSKRIKFLFTFLFLFSLLNFSNFIVAPASGGTDPGAAAKPASGGTDPGAAVDTGGCKGGVCTLPSPLGAKTPEALIGVIVKGVLGIVGAVALLMFIWGGFLWLTAAGSPERVKKGQQTIIWATLGLGVIFTSYALVRFVLQSLGA